MKDFKSDIIHCLEQKEWNKAMKRLKEWEAQGSHNDPDFYFFKPLFLFISAMTITLGCGSGEGLIFFLKTDL